MRTQLKQEISLIKARVITDGTKVAEFISRHQQTYKLITGAVLGGILVDSILDPDIVHAEPRFDFVQQEPAPTEFPVGIFCVGTAVTTIFAAWYSKSRPSSNHQTYKGKTQAAESSHMPQSTDFVTGAPPPFTDDVLRIYGGGDGIIILERTAMAKSALEQYRKKIINVDAEVGSIVNILGRPRPMRDTKEQRVSYYKTCIKAQENIIALYGLMRETLEKRYYSDKYNTKPDQPIIPHYLKQFEELKKMVKNPNLDKETRYNLDQEARRLSGLLVRVTNSPKFFYP